jgi:hypothetical protein
MYEEGTSTPTPENKPVLPPGSLLEFRQLRRLDVTAVALVGRDNTPDAKHTSFEPLTHKQALRVVDSLPHSLEELAFRACFPPIYQAVEVLPERKRQGGLKSLTKIDPLFQKDFTEQKFRTT